ncbi:hypothetical protein FKW77_003339 [Venturia effusa]|uniref:Fucose-specific lectin n=1 Tax=Venturia effusa TaxID=50376 RepID=A0A517L708_9PEZI|nr:hypothetical protein FKW77_003339 [Venturia effusa]
MQVSTIALYVVAILASLVSAQLGLNFASGYDFKVSAGNEVLRSETIYTPGAMEKNIKGILFLWPGLWVPENRTSGDLIQTVIEGSKTGRECRGKPGQWCMAPYVMHGVTRADRDPRQYPVDPDGKIKIIYEKTADGASWNQTTIDMITGKRLQSYVGGKGKKTQFEFSTEMQYGNPGTTSMQLYTDTVITLAKAEGMKFGVGRKKGSAVISGVTSEQGGKVWKIASSHVTNEKSVQLMYDTDQVGLQNLAKSGTRWLAQPDPDGTGSFRGLSVLHVEE